MKRRIVIAGVSLFVTALFFGACSNGGEGDRCDHNADNNGNDDCQDGLECTAASQLNPAQMSDLCCPGDRALAAAGTPCSLAMPTGLGADGAIPAEAAVSDAPISTDAPPDAVGDALIDVVVDDGAADAGDSG